MTRQRSCTREYAGGVTGVRVPELKYCRAYPKKTDDTQSIALPELSNSSAHFAVNAPGENKNPVTAQPSQRMSSVQGWKGLS